MYNLDILEYIGSISYFYNYNNHMQKQFVPTYLLRQESMIILNSSHVVLYMCQTCIHVGH